MSMHLKSFHRLDAAVRPVFEHLEDRRLLSVSLADRVLTIVGTEAGDQITVAPAKQGTQLKVNVNGDVSLFQADDVRQIRAYGLGGDDQIQILNTGSAVKAKAVIDGGAGNDSIAGGTFNDRLIGGPGDDLILGKDGKDFLSGGEGNDSLVGGRGSDAYFGGSGNDNFSTYNELGDKVSDGAGADRVGNAYKPQFPLFTYTGDPNGYRPDQIRHAYGLGDLSNEAYTNRGQGQAIAIITAFHYPSALRDLNTFSRQYGLTLPNKNTFQVIYANGKKPLVDEGWSGEASLDIQWAHAIAPKATILLVEAASAFDGDLARAIDKASDTLNRRFGGGVISMSLGGAESPEQAVALNASISNPANSRITYVASSGDTGGVVSDPASSPNVTAVGGTQLLLDWSGTRTPTAIAVGPNPTSIPAAAAGIEGGESGWVDGGGGPSSVYPLPVWQQNRGTQNTPDNTDLTRSFRTTPDVAMIADSVPVTITDPITAQTSNVFLGVSVFNSTGDAFGAGWGAPAGTSVSSPQFAAIVALANQYRAGLRQGKLGNTLNPRIYRIAGRGSQAFYDITEGSNGTFTAGPGYDLVTGWGSPNTAALIPALADQRINFVRADVKLRVNLAYVDPVSGQRRTASARGTARVSGSSTLSLDNVLLSQVFESNPVGTATDPAALSVFGQDSGTGIAQPGYYDSITRGRYKSTPIILYRNGNAVNGNAIFYYGVASGAAPGGTGTSVGKVRISGTVGKDGSVSLEIESVDESTGNPSRGVTVQTPFFQGSIDT